MRVTITPIRVTHHFLCDATACYHTSVVYPYGVLSGCAVAPRPKLVSRALPHSLSPQVSDPSLLCTSGQVSCSSWCWPAFVWPALGPSSCRGQIQNNHTNTIMYMYSNAYVCSNDTRVCRFMILACNA